MPDLRPVSALLPGAVCRQPPRRRGPASSEAWWAGGGLCNPRERRGLREQGPLRDTMAGPPQTNVVLGPQLHSPGTCPMPTPQGRPHTAAPVLEPLEGPCLMQRLFKTTARSFHPGVSPRVPDSPSEVL